MDENGQERSHEKSATTTEPSGKYHKTTTNKKLNKMSVNRHPPSFACPLTMEVMEDPVMDKCAHNFERTAVMEWLRAGHSCCPISRKPLAAADLLPNHTLAERIERWKWQKEQGDIDWSEEGDNCAECCSETVGTDADGSVQHDEGDVEIGSRKQKRFGKKKKRLVHYESVPAEFMLLPQERHVLQMVRSKAEAEDLKLWKKRCCMAMVTSIVATVSFILIAIGVARIMNDDQDEEN